MCDLVQNANTRDYKSIWNQEMWFDRYDCELRCFKAAGLSEDKGKNFDLVLGASYKTMAVSLGMLCTCLNFNSEQ